MYESDLAVAHRLKDLALEVDGLRVRKIILFGSRARGDARPDSDFDLLVVARGVTPTEKDSYRLALYRAFRGTGVAAEPWVMSERVIEERHGFPGALRALGGVGGHIGAPHVHR